MIQFNLLPDVKKQYVKAKRAKRLIYVGSLIVSAAAVGLTVVMFSYVHGYQSNRIDHKTRQISEKAAEIQQTANLNEILTVQNQLVLLPGLHQDTPETSRVFDYVTFMSPKEVTLQQLDVDYEDSTITLTGSADKLVTVNKFVENVRATRYVVQSDAELSEESIPFSAIETELTGDNDGADFDIVFTFDPIVFDNTQDVILRLNGTTDQSQSSDEGGDNG